MANSEVKIISILSKSQYGILINLISNDNMIMYIRDYFSNIWDDKMIEFYSYAKEKEIRFK